MESLHGSESNRTLSQTILRRPDEGTADESCSKVALRLCPMRVQDCRAAFAEYIAGSFNVSLYQIRASALSGFGLSSLGLSLGFSKAGRSAALRSESKS